MTTRKAFEAFVLQSTGRDMAYHGTNWGATTLQELQLSIRHQSSRRRIARKGLGKCMYCTVAHQSAYVMVNRPAVDLPMPEFRHRNLSASVMVKRPAVDSMFRGRRAGDSRPPSTSCQPITAFADSNTRLHRCTA